jgi:predicted nucleotidyltransferase
VVLLDRANLFKIPEGKVLILVIKIVNLFYGRRRKYPATIKESVKSTMPDAELILYGYYARGDNKPDSDIDLLMLVEGEITYDDEKK